MFKITDSFKKKLSRLFSWDFEIPYTSTNIYFIKHYVSHPFPILSAMSLLLLYF